MTDAGDVELALAFVLLLAVSAAHAVTSFGFVLLSVPLLALLFDPHTAVVAAVLAGALVTAVGWLRERSRVDWPSVGWLTFGGVLGIPLGLLVFTRVDETVLLLVIGVITVLMTLLMAVRVHLPKGRFTELGAGVVSGALLTTTGTNGPPLVLALQAQRLEPSVFRATLQVIFTLQAGFAATGLAVTGQVTGLVLTLFALGAPAALLGWVLGDRIFHRLSASRVRQVVMATLLVSGSALVVTALT